MLQLTPVNGSPNDGAPPRGSSLRKSRHVHDGLLHWCINAAANRSAIIRGVRRGFQVVHAIERARPPRRREQRNKAQPGRGGTPWLLL